MKRFTLIATLVISVTFLAYFTGGVTKSYTHLIYIPIILSGYFWGIAGGTSVGIISGILIGPFMPLNVPEGIMQTTYGWMIRLMILTLVGFITGYLFEKIRRLDEKTKESYLKSHLTGAYNLNELIHDLEERVNNEVAFAMVFIKLINIDEMAKYIEHNFAKNLTKELVNNLTNLYGKGAVFTKGYDEIYLIFSLNSDYLEACNRIIDQYSTAFKVNQFTFKISMKIGIYEYYGGDESPVEIFNKARVASEQGTINETGIHLYDEKFDLNRKKYLEISGSLYESINNNELYLVYQPKINIAENRISGVEVLSRWDRKGKTPVEPEIFIKVAEDIGFIKEISKFVLDNSFSQILEWNKKGIVLDFSINFTTNELLENYFEEWEKKVTESEDIIISKLEIEITERTISQSDDKIIKRIEGLRSKGIKVSIDDFGTGENSLMTTTKIPYDQIKIDKYFIDNLDDHEIRELIKEIINHAHKFSREVVAEGVESKWQLNILRDLNCDFVQGYYYSKPLLANDFEQYYDSFNKTVF